MLCFINHHHLILLQKTVRQKVLEIPHATLKDNELYICLATNDAGQSQASTALSVTGGKYVCNLPFVLTNNYANLIDLICGV